LDGVECYHPNAPLRDCRYLDKLARELNLIRTAGSDFHGGKSANPASTPRLLGKTAGNLAITEEFVDWAKMEALMNHEPH
jgi:hypothetical protein